MFLPPRFSPAFKIIRARSYVRAVRFTTERKEKDLCLFCCQGEVFFPFFFNFIFGEKRRKAQKESLYASDNPVLVLFV